MSVKPILFNAEMVGAILKGHKTQTRRVVSGIENLNVYHSEPAEDAYETLGEWDFLYGMPMPGGGCADCFRSAKAPCSIGDVLWVRETWNYGYIESNDREGSSEEWFEEIKRGGYEDRGYIKALCFFAYQTEFDSAEQSRLRMKWKPSIHMPKEAARIFLCVKNVHVERLNNISEADVCCEGIRTEPYNPEVSLLGFSEIWDYTLKRKEYDTYRWFANPWVWVIEFERCEKPKGW